MSPVCQDTGCIFGIHRIFAPFNPLKVEHTYESHVPKSPSNLAVILLQILKDTDQLPQYALLKTLYSSA